MKKWGLPLGILLTTLGLAVAFPSSLGSGDDLIYSVAPPKSVEVAPPATEIRLKRIERFTPPQDRTVYLYGEVGAATNSVARAIAVLGRTEDPIYLVINSPGGSVLHGLQIINAMQAAKGPIHTICVNMCASMAAMIFEYGNNRIMMDRSMLMFHAASGGMMGEFPKMLSRMIAFERMFNRTETFVATRLGLTLEQYKFMALKEIWADSEYAVENKYADSIAFIDLPDDKMFVESE